MKGIVVHYLLPRSILCLIICIIVGCGGYSASTQKSRQALLRGNAQAAIQSLNAQIDENSKSSEQLLLALERSIALLQVGDHQGAARDLRKADEGLELLDYTKANLKELAVYLYSDDSAPYRPPPFEKAMINLFGVINYLALAEWSSARVESRRLEVLSSFWQGELDQSHHQELVHVKKLIHWMNAFTYMVNGDLDLAKKEAERGHFALPLVPQKPLGKKYSPVLIISSSGMVPHKRAQRLALGRALLYIGPHHSWSRAERAKLARIQAKGLMKWLNFPSLAPSVSGGSESCLLNNQDVSPLLSISLSQLVQKDFKRSSPLFMVAAISRLLSRVALGALGEEIGKKVKGSAVGLLVGLITEGSLAIADTPDTRSWTTLPDQVKLYWFWLPPGDHRIKLDNSRYHGQVNLRVKGDGHPLVLTFPRPNSSSSSAMTQNFQ